MLAVQLTGVALGASATMLGILGCVGGIVFTVSCLGSGRLADRFGPRRAATLAVTLSIAVWLGMAAADRIELLLGLVVLSGAAGAFFWPSVMVWLSNLTSDGVRALTRALGLFNISWSTGLLVGSVVAGALWDWAGQDAFYFAVGAGLIVLTLLQVAPVHKKTAQQQQTRRATETHDARLGQRLCILGRVGLIASFFSTAMVLALFPKVGAELGYSSAFVGWAAGMPYLSAMLVFALARVSSWWQYRPYKLWLAIPLGGAGMGLATFAGGQWQFLVAFSLAGLCTGISYLTSQFYGLHQPEDRRGASMRYHEASVGTGAVAGPLLGGLIADHTGWLPAAFALATGAMVVAGLVQIVLWTVTGRKRERSPA